MQQGSIFSEAPNRGYGTPYWYSNYLYKRLPTNLQNDTKLKESCHVRVAIHLILSDANPINSRLNAYHVQITLYDPRNVESQVHHPTSSSIEFHSRIIMSSKQVVLTVKPRGKMYNINYAKVMVLISSRQAHQASPKRVNLHFR
jgi:hypothetical protein